MDVWGKGVLIVMIAYVVIVVIGLILGQRRCPGLDAAAVVIVESDQLLPDDARTVAEICRYDRPIAVVGDERQAAVRAVIRYFQQRNRYPEVLNPPPQAVAGLKYLCSVTGRHQPTLLYCVSWYNEREKQEISRAQGG